MIWLRLRRAVPFVLFYLNLCGLRCKKQIPIAQEPLGLLTSNADAKFGGPQRLLPSFDNPNGRAELSFPIQHSQYGNSSKTPFHPSYVRDRRR